MGFSFDLGQSVRHVLHQSIACYDPFGEHVIATRSSHDCAIEIRQLLAHVAEIAVAANQVFDFARRLGTMQPRKTRAEGETSLDSDDSHGGTIPPKEQSRPSRGKGC